MLGERIEPGRRSQGSLYRKSYRTFDRGGFAMDFQMTLPGLRQLQMPKPLYP